MIYCKKCLQPDTRPREKLVDGICTACRNFSDNEKFNLDWEYRLSILEKLFSDYKRKNSAYDCVLGVSGGKDSLRQALWLRDAVGIRPLLVSLAYPPQQMTVLGEKNLSNLISHGFDVHFVSPKPLIWKKLMREGFLTFGNWAMSTEIALYASVPQAAIQFKIPLMFTGENQSLRDPKTLSGDPWNYNDAIKQNTLNNGNIDWMKKVHGVEDADLYMFRYPTSEEFSKNGLQLVDLGWFIKKWNNQENARFSALSGLEVRQDAASITGDPYGVSALDDDWVAVNQMIKFYKFGYGKATDYMNEDIREGRRSREEAIEFVEQYDGACSVELVTSFCDYIQISKQEFWATIEKFVNYDLFYRNGDRYIKKFKVGSGLN